MALVILPRSLAAILPGLPRRTSVDGATVADVVAALDASWPGLADRILEPGPSIREHINVFVDGEPAELSTQVPAGATIHIIPAAAGG
jgi:molybdopterin synthase sulfur carrier subunit